MTATRAALAAAALLVSLTACGEPAGSPTTVNVDETQDSLLDQMEEEQRRAESPWAQQTDEFTKTMEDGRMVPCLVLRYYDSASLECDFARATYSDSTEVTP